MKICFLILIFFARTFFAQTNTDSSDVINFPQEHAEFPGGNMAMLKLFRDRFTLSDSDNSESRGCCSLHFRIKISTTGKASDVQLLRNSCGLSDAEKKITAIVDNMPAWKPAKLKGLAVDSYYSIPIRIRIQ